jgi:hypothetical protein
MDARQAFKQTLIEIRGVVGGVSYRSLIDRFEQLTNRRFEAQRKKLRLQYGEWLQSYANNHPHRIKIIRPYNLSTMPNVEVTADG